eukprot:COSAG02_NODE_6360_length_3624_cov_2.571915_2_plen_527_part_00
MGGAAERGRASESFLVRGGAERRPGARDSSQARATGSGVGGFASEWSPRPAAWQTPCTMGRTRSRRRLATMVAPWAAPHRFFRLFRPRPRPVRRPPPPLPPPNVARKEKQLVRTRSGCGVIESPLEQRITQNTQVLYHVTDAASARAIEESGVMLRGRSNCLFGSGIYFAKTVDIAARKARSAGAVVTAEVDLGRSYLPEAGDATLGFRKLQEMGFDSVHGRAAPLGPLRFHDEYVVYNADQVRVVSVSVPPEPKADEPESPCGILARCLMLAAVVWLAFDVARGCVLSGCENGGECEGIVFRTCTCAGLHAGTRCAHHCNVSALLHSVPRPRPLLSLERRLLARSARAMGRRQTWRARTSRLTMPPRAPAVLATATTTTPARLAATAAAPTAPATARPATAPTTSQARRVATAVARTAPATALRASAETATPAPCATAAAKTMPLPTAAPGARAPASTLASTASSLAAAATAGATEAAAVCAVAAGTGCSASTSTRRRRPRHPRPDPLRAASGERRVDPPRAPPI